MSTTVDDIRRSALNKYREYLLSFSSSYILSTPFSFFPWVYKGSKGKRSDSYKESLELYSVLYASSKEKTGRGYTITTEKVNTRFYGEQTIIKEITIESGEDYLSFIGKEKESKVFVSALEDLKRLFSDNSFPLEDLYTWTQTNLGLLTEKQEDGYYDDIMRVLVYLMNHSSLNLYIREIPLPVHTKFIEENEKTILSLYTAITKKETLSSFEDTFSLKKKEALIRWRSMNNREETGLRLSDFSLLDTSKIKRVYIVENEIVYLTFPLENDMMIIFGGGFGAVLLKKVEWLKTKEIYYFGDMDEHGYEILALFRSFFPQTRSFLMDRETYLDHLEYAVKGKKSTTQYDNFLTPEELSVLSSLRSNPDKSRIEQERISNEYIKKRLSTS